MPRYFLNEVYYFVTVPTFDHEPFFLAEDAKYYLLNKLKTTFQENGITEYDYSIMNNHYHFIAYFKSGDLIPRLLKTINGSSAAFVNKYLSRSGRVWDDYHIYIASTEQIYERIRGYVIGNPLKHGEVESLGALENHPFSSFKQVVKKNGREYAEELVNSVINIDEEQFFKCY